MKKFDTLISSYLYSNKQLEIEGLGRFWLDEHFVLPPDAEKAAFFPLEGIHFQFNSRAETSAGLLDCIVQQTGKIRSLVQADFSSYAAEIKQFVNIGKPWVIEGIGTLQKNKQGVFELIPGEALSERIDINYADETEDDDEPVKRRRWMVGFILVLAIIAVVAGLGFGIYVLFIKTQDPGENNQPVATVFPADTSSVISTDTISIRPDSTVYPSADSSNYKVIHEITSRKERALTRTSQLNGFGLKSYIDSMAIGGAMQYRLFIFRKILPADTSRVRDSLSVYFGRKVRLEKIR